MKELFKLLPLAVRLWKSDILRYHNVFGYTWAESFLITYRLRALKGRYIEDQNDRKGQHHV